MVIKPETEWSINGESLHTFARNISTLAGRIHPAPLRGSDLVIPYQPGQTWVRKMPDSKILNLAMWVRGELSTGGRGQRKPSDLFDENWRELVRLCWQPRKQLLIEKKVKVGNTLRPVQALGEFVGGLEPSMIGRNAAKTVVDLKLADPFFYDKDYKVVNLVNGDQTIQVDGDAETTNVRVVFNGSRDNPQVRVKSPIDHLVRYNGPLLTGETATLIVRTHTAETKPNAIPTYDSSGRVTHAGDPYWLVLSPGANIINLTSSFGTGSVQLMYKEAWH